MISKLNQSRVVDDVDEVEIAYKHDIFKEFLNEIKMKRDSINVPPEPEKE